MSYNIITKSLETKLNGYQVSSLGAGNYLTLLSAPPLANVQLQLNDNTAPRIPFNEGDTLEAKNVDRIYISADVVSGGKLVFGQSNSDQFKIIPAPKVNDINEIGKIDSFDNVLLNAIDKLINPYDTQSTTLQDCSTNSTTLVTVLDEVLTCDKIILSSLRGNAQSGSSTKGLVYLDSVLVYYFYDFFYLEGSYNAQSDTINFENIKGKRLQIQTASSSSSQNVGFSLQKLNKKA